MIDFRFLIDGSKSLFLFCAALSIESTNNQNRSFNH